MFVITMHTRQKSSEKIIIMQVRLSRLYGCPYERTGKIYEPVRGYRIDTENDDSYLD